MSKLSPGFRFKKTRKGPFAFLTGRNRRFFETSLAPTSILNEGIVTLRMSRQDRGDQALNVLGFDPQGNAAVISYEPAYKKAGQAAYGSADQSPNQC